jgi:hypothetical protein
MMNHFLKLALRRSESGSSVFVLVRIPVASENSECRRYPQFGEFLVQTLNLSVISGVFLFS